MDWSLFGFEGIREVFNLHPLFVHFPVALFPTAFLCYCIAIFAKRATWEFSGRICLLLATIECLQCRVPNETIVK